MARGKKAAEMVTDGECVYCRSPLEPFPRESDPSEEIACAECLDDLTTFERETLFALHRIADAAEGLATASRRPKQVRARKLTVYAT